ncbi:MAG TPA: DUF934 domain-containing protein [Burkholderiales bacterium]|jgi:uncharacterized protein (DUF934 family)
MTTLIKGRALAPNTWRTIAADRTQSGELPPGEDLIVPLPLWFTQRVALLARAGRTGVWLQPADDPAALVTAPPLPDLIAVHFPVFSDGRGYSTARLLRERHGFRGELRAIGDVLRDQLFELTRCGFDAFELRPDQDAAQALKALDDFTEVYQAATDRGPLFERRFGLQRGSA